MDPQAHQLYMSSLYDDIEVNEQIFSNFSTKSAELTKRQLSNFTQYDNQLIQKSQNKTIIQNPRNPLSISSDEGLREKYIKERLKHDTLFNKIIQNQGNKQYKQKKNTFSPNQQEFYSFNFDLFYVFADTPEFKQSLTSPLKKFHNQFKDRILLLQHFKLAKPVFKQLSLQSNPTTLKEQPALYFVGIALTCKKLGLLFQTFFFYHLAVYSSPFDQKIWESYIQFLQKNGYWKQAFNISKTAFLFNPKVGVAQQYLLSGEKAGVPPYQLRALLSSLNQPQKYQKIIIESAKLQIKRRKTCRGLQLLYRYCSFHDFSISLYQTILLISKLFQRLDLRKASRNILMKILSQKNVRFQIYDYLIQNLMRDLYTLREQQVKIILDYIKYSVIQTKFRILLGVAQSVGNKQLQYKYYLEALKYCRNQKIQQQSRKKAYRQIYLRILSFYCMPPTQNLLISYKNDDYLKFYFNKARFVKGQPLQLFNFKDWKFYLHYALEKNCQVLQNAYKQFQQGRILAQYFHIVRIRKSPLAVLKLWRKKIQEAPKSGQLWCQGGRIYAQLGQFSNAKRCLEVAIHFTPQYGDSFFELLKIYISENLFYQINQLKKNFFMSEPYYGNVFSFLRIQTSYDCIKKYSLNKMWQKCQYEIKQKLYNKNQNQLIKNFTACQNYNKCFMSLHNKEVRQKLFISYEMIQNKFSK